MCSSLLGVCLYYTSSSLPSGCRHVTFIGQLSDVSLLRRNFRSQAKELGSSLFQSLATGHGEVELQNSQIFLALWVVMGTPMSRGTLLKVAGGAIHSKSGGQWVHSAGQRWAFKRVYCRAEMTRVCCESWFQMGRPRELKSGAGGKCSTLRGAAAKRATQRSRLQVWQKEKPTTGLGECSCGNENSKM